ncbi:MAG: hypothetical protein IJX62_03115 [Clostridia bacterium]|nr:hypothetical protein [Clostridia bacterium]
MEKFLLNGTWKYQVGQGEPSSIDVPFSRLPVGRSECVKRFDLPKSAARTFLKFDGITYYARVTLNNVDLGEMLPYCEYEFDITDLVKPTGNTLSVILEDINRSFGPSEGWQNFGGIIRDVYLILRNESYIENVFFHSTLRNGYRDAEILTEVKAVCPTDATLRIELFDGDERVLSYCQQVGHTQVASMCGVKLWSPQTPTLYSLSVSLVCDGSVVDIYRCAVGFREISHDRHRFLLNGNPLFLKGVCKHEMVGDSGHCPTTEQVESDLRMIKEMGCNFVRLVHYPHDKKVLDIADRLGLLVSEEPGLWWSDTSQDEVREGSKEVLRRTVLRDRNHPSVAFWLCFNECKFTERFLWESAEICRQYDPTRMVSGANCMNDEDTLLYYNRCRFDFYTMHPYSDTFARAQKSAEILCDKPLLFTEWGGYYMYDNPHLLLDFMTKMSRLYHHGDDNGALAGAFFWFFAELNDFNRGAPACIDGVLREGLVDQNRNPTLIYNAFRRGLALFDEDTEKVQHPFWYEPTDSLEELAAYRRLIPVSEDVPSNCLILMQNEAVKKGTMRKRKITNGPFLQSVPLLSDVPGMMTLQKPLVFEGGIWAEELSVIGLVTPINGYPLGLDYGEPIGNITVYYQGGHKQILPLKNGIHVTTVYGLNGSSEINPIAKQARRFARFGYEKNFEVYILNRLDVTTDPTTRIEHVEFLLENAEVAPLIYGVFAKAPHKSGGSL